MKMNVFVPYSSPLDCANALWKDSKRFNKQIIECKQILAAIDGGKAWKNHPICLMYKKHKEWLKLYLWCFEAYRKSQKTNIHAEYVGLILGAKCYSNKADAICPSFLTEEFCIQHRKRLYTKAPELYPQFAKYGKSDINYYFVNGQLLKYRNGKRIKE